jgi:hypothetical protein
MLFLPVRSVFQGLRFSSACRVIEFRCADNALRSQRRATQVAQNCACKGADGPPEGKWAGPSWAVLPKMGGSVQICLFHEDLHTPVIGLPIVNHDNNRRAANENAAAEFVGRG